MQASSPFYGVRDCRCPSQGIKTLTLLCSVILLIGLDQALAQNAPAGTVQNAIGTLVVIT
jgi:hypothetical protein